MKRIISQNGKTVVPKDMFAFTIRMTGNMKWDIVAQSVFDYGLEFVMAEFDNEEECKKVFLKEYC